jgi:hypothetical protein
LLAASGSYVIAMCFGGDPNNARDVVMVNKNNDQIYGKCIRTNKHGA